MNTIIVGGGKIGSYVARLLREEDHDVTIVDTDSDKVAEVTGAYDIMGIVGNGADYSVLSEAGIDDTDLFIAVTGEDELNLLCCVLATQNKNCTTLARVRNPLYLRQMELFKERLGISMIINPEYESAHEISKILRFPSAIKVETFSKGNTELLSFKVTKDQRICGMSVGEVHAQIKVIVMICAVKRGDEVIIVNGSSVIEEGDIVYFMASPQDTQKFFKKIGHESRQVKNCLIVGGGAISLYLTKFLTEYGIPVRIIEKDRDRCEYLCEHIPEAVIVNADASDFDQLMEEGLEHAESFVTLTNIDEENVFLSLYAKKNSKAKVISKVNRLSVEAMASEMETGSIITPTITAANYILKHARAMNNSLESNNIERLYKLINGRVEALEFSVNEISDVVGVKIRDLKLKDNLLICFILRGEESFIPFGSDSIEVNDSVIIFTTNRGLNKIDDILK
ncbi:MAG: Trk system potassium transporter TrkA [Lachnospiraceae bacterium]|nr:Trk system potassium transporter TrkA [Lachnospiraceae bacterium]